MPLVDLEHLRTGRRQTIRARASGLDQPQLEHQVDLGAQVIQRHRASVAADTHGLKDRELVLVEDVHAPAYRFGRRAPGADRQVSGRFAPRGRAGPQIADPDRGASGSTQSSTRHSRMKYPPQLDAA